jgi:hypothetical protein
MRILHIAPYNTAGVPITFVNAERLLGHDSRLVTLHRDKRGYQEDISLELPMWQPEIVAKLKKICYPKSALVQNTQLAVPGKIPPVWRPANRLAGLLIAIRDAVNKPIVERNIKKYRLDAFDVYQLDGGHGFLKHDVFLPKWHSEGKKIICCYLGSDLRRRGMMPGIDDVSDLNLTLEWDHLKLHPNMRHVYFPFDNSSYKMTEHPVHSKIRIGHSPSNRAAKGSDRIIAAVKNLSAKYPVELVLIEGLPYVRALEMKFTCDIGIDQLGELGYGISALEWMAMGIPVASSIAPAMKEAGVEHPIISIDERDIEIKLAKLIEDRDYRLRVGLESRRWVELNHDAKEIVIQIHTMAGLI